MFQLTLACPEKAVYTEVPIKEITLPGETGEVNILTGHAPMVMTMGSGIVSVQFEDGQADYLSVAWGYCEVGPGYINLLVEMAVSRDEINQEQLKSERETAEKAMLHESLDEHGFERYFTKLQEIDAQERLVSMPR